MSVYQPRAKRPKKGTDPGPLFTGLARPRYVLGTRNVFDGTLDRIRWLFEEFDGKVAVGNSGGKDSTVVVELALMVARERGELPLTVFWLDQECEFEATVEYQRWLADRPEINFQWYQIPFRLYNAANHDDPWLNVWGEGEEWVREKEIDSIQEEFTWKGEKVDRFKEVLNEINFRSDALAILTGMRCEESPARRITMTTQPAYKWITWSVSNKRPEWKRPGREPYFLFHPIYDWTYRDVWKAIHDNGWKYNRHYDVMFQYGVPVRKMRVSNYHHETAISALFYLQESEPDTWAAATRRLAGLSVFSHQTDKDQVPTSLPFMFKDWDEYLEHLIVNLVPKEDYRVTFRKMYQKMQVSLPNTPREVVARAMVRAVIGNDLYGTTTEMFIVTIRNKERQEASTDRALLRLSEEEAFTS